MIKLVQLNHLNLIYFHFNNLITILIYLIYLI